MPNSLVRSIKFPVFRMVRFAFMAVVSGASCSEATGLVTIDPPTGVSAVLISPTSARITWTAGAQSERVTGYNLLRNGAKVAEVQTTSHVDEGLVELKSYIYTVSANGRDGIVSALSAESAVASVTPPDVTAPRVTATVPAAAGLAVPRATTLRATFSEAMTPSTINTSTFLVRTSAGSNVAGTMTYLPATFAAEFVPTPSLPNATGIVVTITTGVRDQAGNAMTAAFGFAFAVRDEIAPSVSSVTPADSATGVSVETSAVIVFSETMDAATINQSSVALRHSATGVIVPGGVSYDAAGRAATFIPAAPLNRESSYTVHVSTAVKDASSNALIQPFASTFATAPGVAPPPLPLEKRIAFAGPNQQFGWFILVADANGSNIVALAAGDGPTWSPSGARLLYSDTECDFYYGCGSGGLVLMDPDTRSKTMLSNGRLGTNPSWSPDGKTIAFIRRSDNPVTAALELAGLDGSPAVRLNMPGITPREPSWSPDGQRIVFGCSFGPSISDQEICIINRDGTGLLRVTTDAVFDTDPAWSPDGSRIAFETNRFGPQMHIALMTPSGTGITQLTNGFSPTWSSEGSKLVFARDNGLFTINSDGSNVTRLTTGGHDNPSLRP